MQQQYAIALAKDGFWNPAELLDVLRVSVETRKTQLVDAALDCVQRLISHGILSGPVQSINHRREAASKAAGPRKKQGDDDDDADPAAQGPMPPQVSQQVPAPGALPTA